MYFNVSKIINIIIITIFIAPYNLFIGHTHRKNNFE